MGSVETLPEVVAARSTEVADAVSDAVARHVVPFSIWLTAEHQRGQVLRMVKVERALDLALAGGLLADEDLHFFQGLGIQFARHAVPLSVLTTAFDVGIATAIREFWRIAPAARFVEMAQFTAWAARIAEQARQASIRAYLETGRVGSGPPSARRIVAEALISGESPTATAQAMGERLASSYLVLACTVSAPTEVNARRLAEIHRDIESVPGALHCGDLSRMVVLLPVESSLRQAEGVAEELVGGLCSLAGRTVLAARAHRPDLVGIPAAYEEARCVLSLVSAIPDAAGRPYRMDELLVELAILRQPDIGQRLGALLLPLDAGADLRRTLEVLLACNLDRERAAKELCIHRRTLRYRLDRIRDLSGIDPDSVQGLQLLRAALTAIRLEAMEPQDQRPETASPSSPDSIARVSAPGRVEIDSRPVERSTEGA